MIQEHFCNYENSLALKELGFSDVGENLAGSWDMSNKEFVRTFGYNMHYFEAKHIAITAPLLSQAIQWTQSMHDLWIEIKWDSELMGWKYEIYDWIIHHKLAENSAYKSWNQCAQDAITKALQIIKDEGKNL